MMMMMVLMPVAVVISIARVASLSDAYTNTLQI
jgi:hypothetical protein